MTSGILGNFRRLRAARAEVRGRDVAGNAVPEIGAVVPRLRVVSTGNGTAAPGDAGMPCRFAAIVLLSRGWEIDAAAVAATVRLRFPTIGRIGVREAGDDAPAAVLVDRAPVTLSPLRRLPPERLSPPMRPIRIWDAEPALRQHVGAVEIACGAGLPGGVDPEAVAAVVHFVTTATCAVAPASAVFWRTGWTLNDPDVFGIGGETILDGRLPLGTWVGFAEATPADSAPGGVTMVAGATGMVTYGLRPFIGRELELAPRPGGGRQANRLIRRVARAALDRELVLADGQRLVDPEPGIEMTVRERDFWLRRDVPAFVLFADDSVVDEGMPGPADGDSAA